MNPTNGYLKIRHCPECKEYYIYYLFDRHGTIYGDFDFKQYPMDRQECEFRLGSHSYGESLAFGYFNSSPYENHFSGKGLSIDIRFFESLYSNQFPKVQKFQNQSSKVAYYKRPYKNNLKEVGFTIALERHLEHFIMRYYLPCTAIVLISLTSFVIPPDKIPGRITLLATQFLTMTNIFIRQQVNLPFLAAVSYTHLTLPTNREV